MYTIIGNKFNNYILNNNINQVFFHLPYFFVDLPKQYCLGFFNLLFLCQYRGSRKPNRVGEFINYNIMKKLMSIFAACLFVFALTSCDGGDAASADSAASGSEEAASGEAASE